MKYSKAGAPNWVRAILFGAFSYSLFWGLAILFFPNFLFNAAHLETLRYPFTWEIAGAAECIFGLGYLLAFKAPYRHWPLVLMGFMFKLVSISIFFVAAEGMPVIYNLNEFMLVTEVAWLPLFLAVLVNVYRQTFSSDDLMIELFSGEEYSLDMFETNKGEDLRTLSFAHPVMLVFLRHFGCTFCREAMADIALNRKEIEEKGTKIILVHMLEDEQLARTQLEKYKLEDISTISDPECILYKKFRLRKGSIFQLYGWKIWFRGIIAGYFKGYGIGRPMGDPNQMPGIFLVFRDKIMKSFIHTSAADRPQYVQFASCEIC